MEKIDLIKEAIRKGVNHNSKLDDLAFGVGSFTSPNIRHILNNLGSISKKYLEIGLHLGGTFVATCYGNKELEATGVDNWSQFNNDDQTKNDCLKTVEKLLADQPVKVVDKDCFRITDEIEKGFDFYLYDGSHDKVSQHDALTYFKDYMADEFILVVDDASWGTVREGTFSGIKDAGLTILYEIFLFDGIEGGAFWNGLMVFLLKK